MGNGEIINKVVRFTEHVTNGGIFSEAEISGISNLLYRSPCNLNIYRGILFVHHFYKFKKLPQGKFQSLGADDMFLKCVSLLNGNILPPLEIESLFSSILNIPNREAEYRDILLGSFYGSLWALMNDPKNFEMAVDYGIVIIKSAFSIDKFNFSEKIKLQKNNTKLINLAGSGKKEIKSLNLSSMTAVITAAIGKKIGVNIIVEKTISRATSSITGSADIFESVGVNLDMPINKIAAMSLETNFGVIDINNIVPKLNRIYDGRLYNVQVFAGLVGGAAIVNPVDTDLINYGLTRGATKLCSTILNRLYPNKNILVLQGKNPQGKSIIDQISIAADTEIAQRINGRNSLYTMTPDDFGFNPKPFKYIKTSESAAENITRFIKLLAGHGNLGLKQAIAMEVALNLYGLKIIDDLKMGANLALEVIDSKAGVKILENLVIASHGDINKFSRLTRDFI